MGIMRRGTGWRGHAVAVLSVVGMWVYGPEWALVIVLLALVSGLHCPGSWPVVYYKLVEILNGRAVLMIMWINFHQLLP